jgi:hypothetical protein
MGWVGHRSKLSISFLLLNIECKHLVLTANCMFLVNNQLKSHTKYKVFTVVSIQITVFCVLTNHVAPLFGLVLGFCAVVDVCYNVSEEHGASVFRLTK